MTTVFICIEPKPVQSGANNMIYTRKQGRAILGLSLFFLDEFVLNKTQQGLQRMNNLAEIEEKQ